MAYALKIIGTLKTGKEVEVAPSWWNKDELRKNYDFTKDYDLHCIDYFLFVDKPNFTDIMEIQDQYRINGMYASKYWKPQNDKTKKELDDFLLNLTEDSLIKLFIYEWESGY